MKKIALILVSVLLFWIGTAFGGDSSVTTAIGTSATSGQVTCGGTATVLLAKTPTGRLSVTFQNQSSPVVPVYIAPRSDISTSNAGIILDSTRGLSVTMDRSSGDVVWYCITAGGDATVGYTEERQQ